MMNKRLLLAFSSVLIFLTVLSHAMERDFVYTTQEKEFCSNAICLNLLKQYVILPSHLQLEIVPVLQKHQCTFEVCPGCGKQCQIYAGYFIFKYRNGYPFLNDQINYTKKYPNFQAYWPETSQKAEHLNTIAMKLFKDLFKSTALKRISMTIPAIRTNFIASSDTLSDAQMSELMPTAVIAQCFWFSHYSIVCKDLGAFSDSISENKKFYSRKEHWKIIDQLGEILNTLAPLFEDMYKESLSLHATEEIERELQLLYSLSGRDQMKLFEKSTFTETVDNENFEYQCRSSHTSEKNLTKYEFLLQLGTILNESFLHSDAITTLTKAIELEKHEVDALIERAHAFFELNQIDLALKDYERTKHNKHKKGSPPRCSVEAAEVSCGFEAFLFDEILYDNEEGDFYTKSLKHYVAGFCVGATKGAGDGVVDYVPNVLSCCRGMLHGLWAFAKDPVGKKNKFIEFSQFLIERMKNDTLREQLELVVPELKDLFLQWDALSSYDKGEKVGYIIGKYGVDIFIPIVTLKTVHHFLVFKRANTLKTLKACKSKTDKVKVLEKSAEHAKARNGLWNVSRAGKIIPQDGNKIPHIMQKKHSWDKLIKLTGNQTEDFKKVAALLEKNKILSQIKFVKTDKYGMKVMRSEIIIQGYKVEARFIQYQTNETFLTNAWVATK